MSVKVILGRLADRDLLTIATYIETNNPRAASVFVRDIRRRLEGLHEFPEQGRIRNDFGPGIRALAFDRKVLIAYKFANERVDILRVFYGGQDIESAMRRDAGHE